MNRRTLALAAISCVWGAIAADCGGQIYVDAGASGGANDGSSWANAYTNLQAALANAGSGTNLWVAQGAYYPGTARSDTFWLDNVTLYGGFTNGMTSLDERDWVLYETILSGDIGTPGAKTDNSYHVVTWTNTVVLDGFTVAYGNCDTELKTGSAFYNSIPETTTTLDTNQNATLRNCTVRDNTDPGGGAVSSRSAVLTVSNCTFRANSQSGMANREYCKSMIQDSRFIGNGAYGFYAPRVSGSMVTNCVFAANASYGLYHYYRGSGLKVVGCIFSGNTKQGYANTQTYATGRLQDCLIGANGGGIVFSTLRDTPVIQNCVVAGNSTSLNGGGCYIADGNNHPEFNNCTFAMNYAAGKGGGLYVQDSATLTSTPRMYNCIFWYNTTANPNDGGEIYATYLNTGRARMSYTDIEGGLPGPKVVGEVIDLGTNINANPLFAPSVTGAWTANAAWNATDGQTVLTDAGASWVAGQFTKLFLNPDTAQNLQYVVATNTATTIAIWGNASAFAAAGDSYAVYDYHEQSKAGRWTPGGVWVKDRANSPCIDAGDTNLVWQREPEPNGNRINIGAYGNTPEASLTYLIPKASLIILR